MTDLMSPTAQPKEAPHWPRGSLVRGFPETARLAVLSRGSGVEIPAGSRFLRQGDTTSDVFILLDGLVKVTADTEDGGSALLAIRVTGDAVGELANLDGLPRNATVTAAGLVRARRISRAGFAAFLAEHPEAALAVSRSISAKLRAATRRRIDFGTYSVAVRFARILVELAARHGHPAPGGIDVGLELSQPELAALIGAAEPSVHRSIRELRRLGCLTTGYRRFVITDLPRLRDFAHLTDTTPDDVI